GLRPPSPRFAGRGATFRALFFTIRRVSAHLTCLRPTSPRATGRGATFRVLFFTVRRVSAPLTRPSATLSPLRGARGNFSRVVLYGQAGKCAPHPAFGHPLPASRGEGQLFACFPLRSGRGCSSLPFAQPILTPRRRVNFRVLPSTIRPRSPLTCLRPTSLAQRGEGQLSRIRPLRSRRDTCALTRLRPTSFRGATSARVALLPARGE